MPTKASFLIVDDEREICNFFSYLLKKKGYTVDTAISGAEAFEKIAAGKYDTALIDLKLPDTNGLEILKEIKKSQPDCQVIIITGYSTVKTAVEAIQLGAFDYVEKPFVDINEMEELIERSLNVRAETEKFSLAQEELGFVIGHDQKMLNLVSAARKIAKKNITVLIQGETGTGKEVLARYIHSASHRSRQPFLAFNCGAFTETLLESELFGHEKGSFTGATHQKKGIFEQAHKATLFLDEIDSASPAIQIKLLRVLETGEYFRVGGEEMCKVDARIIAATNANLPQKVAENKFREDLFYRLDVASLHVPPLRERKDDLEYFINYFLQKESSSKNIPLKKFSPQAMKMMLKHDWPGNIRELSNTVAQALLLSKTAQIAVHDLPERIIKSTAKIKPPALKPQQKLPQENIKPAGPETTAEPGDLLEEYERTFLEKISFRQGFDFKGFSSALGTWRDQFIARVIEAALEDTYGNQVKAAELLGITPRALRYHLQKASESSKIS